MDTAIKLNFMHCLSELRMCVLEFLGRKQHVYDIMACICHDLINCTTSFCLCDNHTFFFGRILFRLLNGSVE